MYTKGEFPFVLMILIAQNFLGYRYQKPSTPMSL